MTFEELYQTYSKLVLNLALQYVQNIEDAEEITQDVFISVHQSLSTFNHKASFQTWIYRITINKSLDYIKRKNRQKRITFITSIFDKENVVTKAISQYMNHPGIIMEQKEAVEHIFKGINILPDQQKTALILSKLEYKSQKEVAEIMNLSTKAVESLLQRAKTNMLKYLNNNEGNRDGHRLIK
ncbi:MAG: RNA polymerase sigma factor [Saprospiraceae bacterium]